jgi:hypothetical protein
MTSPTPEYRTIPLTKGQVAIIDTEDFEHLSKLHWHAAVTGGNTFYAARRKKTDDGKWSIVYLHRELLGLIKGDRREVDHINHNTLDNRRSNLRIATRQQNVMNTRRLCQPGLKGTFYSKNAKKWTAQLTVDRKAMHLGYFPTEEAAHSAYCEAAQKYHGEHAYIDVTQSP